MIAQGLQCFICIKLAKWGTEMPFLSFCESALMYNYPRLLPDEYEKKSIEIVLSNTKNFLFRDVPEGWIKFFAKYLPNSSIHKLEIWKHAERIIKYLPKSLTTLDIIYNNIGSKRTQNDSKSCTIQYYIIGY